MKTLEVTDEQYAYVQQLRAELSEQVVGKYGHVRDRDALQYLIDNLDGELEVDVDVELSATADAGAEDAPSTAVDAGEASTAEEVSYDEEADTVSPDERDDDAEDDADEEAAESDDGADDDSDAGDGGDGEAGEGDGSASDDDMLDRMMNLLDTHDDKWEESPSADYRYRVELPDGSTEDVQTKDDVRALLFQNY